MNRKYFDYDILVDNLAEVTTFLKKKNKKIAEELYEIIFYKVKYLCENSMFCSINTKLFYLEVQCVKIDELNKNLYYSIIKVVDSFTEDTIYEHKQ